MKTKTNKNLNIETLRGMAIVLVVLGHVIGSASDGGMKVDDDSFLRYVYYTFEYLRMPLFTVISGWVYALRPAAIDNAVQFMIKKARRILIPMIFVGGLYYVIQSLVPGTNFSNSLEDIWKIIVYPYTFYWYLHSLFLVFLIAAIIDSFKLMKTAFSLILVTLISILCLVFRDALIPEAFPNYFGFKGAIYLFPFFVVGVGIQRFKSVFQNKTVNQIMGIILLFSLAVQQLVWFGILEYEFSESAGLGLVIGLFGTIVFFRSKLNIRPMVWIGNYSYTIFLFHSFGTSGGRIILQKIGVTSPASIFFFSLFLGLFLPIVLEKVLDKFNLTRVLFLGRPIRKKAAYSKPSHLNTSEIKNIAN
jgi:fucose 4-O-acetylase-like acetyltransferase